MEKVCGDIQCQQQENQELSINNIDNSRVSKIIVLIVKGYDVAGVGVGDMVLKLIGEVARKVINEPVGAAEPPPIRVTVGAEGQGYRGGATLGLNAMFEGERWGVSVSASDIIVRADDGSNGVDQIGDFTGRCATRHNLDSANRDRALQARGGRPPRRLLRSAAVASAFVLLGGGGGSV